MILTLLLAVTTIFNDPYYQEGPYDIPLETEQPPQKIEQPKSSQIQEDNLETIPQQLQQSRQSLKSAPKGSSYPHPGLVVVEGSGVIGTDHLYNLSANIEILVEIVKAPDIELGITDGQLESLIIQQFKKIYVEPQATSIPGQPLLPLFHLLIMVNPINEGYVVFMEGRLFEKVKLDRVRFEENTAFQGITWATQSLLVTPKNDIDAMIRSNTASIAKLFADRFAYYDDLKERNRRRNLSK